MGKGNKAKGKKKTVNTEALSGKLQTALNGCAINKHQGALVISRFLLMFNMKDRSKSDKDYSKTFEKLVSDAVTLFEESSTAASAHFKLLLDAKAKGSNRSKYSSMLDEIAKIRKEIDSGDAETEEDEKKEIVETKEENLKICSEEDDQVALDDAEYADLKHIENFAQDNLSELLKVFQLVLKKDLPSDKLKALLDLKLDIIRRKRIAVGFSVVSSQSVSSVSTDLLVEYTQAILYLLDSALFKVVKADASWKIKVLETSKLEGFISLLLDIASRVDGSKMLKGWSVLKEQWLMCVQKICDFNSLLPFVLELESFVPTESSTSTWLAQKQQWVNVAVKLSLLHQASTTILFSRQLLFLELHVSIPGSWEANRAKWIDSISLSSTISHLCDAVSDFAKNLPNSSLVKAWNSAAIPWQARLSHCQSFNTLSDLLMELEAHISWNSLAPDWPELRSGWLKRLSVKNIDVSDLQKLKDAVIDFEKCISSRAYQDAHQDRESRALFRRNVLDCTLALDIGLCLVELESKLIKDALGVEWVNEYSEFWKEGILSSTTANQVAVWFYDFQNVTSPQMTKQWTEVEKTMGTRLKALAVANASGRLASIKSCLISLEINTNKESAMKSDWSSQRQVFMHSLARAKTSIEVAELFRSFLDSTDDQGSIGVNAKAQWRWRIDQPGQALQPRTVSVLLLQFAEDLDASFFRQSWRTQKFRFTSLLRLVNKELVTEGIITILKNYLVAFSRGMHHAAMLPNWNSISDDWEAGVQAQTACEELGHYMIAFEKHISADSLHPIWVQNRKYWEDYVCNFPFTNGSLCASIVSLESSVHPNSFVPMWIFSRDLWLQTFLDTALEDEGGYLEILKYAAILLAMSSKKDSEFIQSLSFVSSAATLAVALEKTFSIVPESVSCAEIAKSLEKLKKKVGKVGDLWSKQIEELLRDIANPSNGLYSSVRSLKVYAAGFFANLSDNSFKSDFLPHSKTESQFHPGYAGFKSRMSYFLDESKDVGSLASRVLTGAQNLKTKTFTVDYHGEIAESVLHALKNASSPFDIGGCLRTMDLYVKKDAYVLPVNDHWSVLRAGFLHGLKRYEMQELKFIQEMQRAVFDLVEDEAGHTTIGHNVVDERDRQEAEQTGSDLLFGELLVDGVSKCIDRLHMDGTRATSLCDLGMGLGKLAMQAWLMHKSLKYVVGVELARTRYALGEEACLRMVKKYPDQYKLVFHEYIDPKRLRIAISDTEGRILEFRKQDLFLVKDEGDKGGLTADIVITETHFPEATVIKLCKHLNGMKKGARLLTYENLHKCYGNDTVRIPMPFKQLAINVSEEDRFPTTWSTVRGHHFYLWEKITEAHQNE